MRIRAKSKPDRRIGNNPTFNRVEQRLRALRKVMLQSPNYARPGKRLTPPDSAWPRLVNHVTVEDPH